MSYDPSLTQVEFDKVLQHVEKDLATLRTGKAAASLLDPVRVEAYGTQMQLHEVASISAPDANLLVVSPWDKSLLSACEKAIGSSGLNLNPVVDKDIIRIVVPALTAERRQDMVKLLHQKIESGRVAVRTTRNEGRKAIEDEKGAAGVSEDDITQLEKDLDQQTQKTLTLLEEMQAAKEKELLTM